MSEYEFTQYFGGLMIQLISNNEVFKNDKDIQISRLDSPKNFGDFELNIIDLNYQGIWSSRTKSSEGSSTINTDIHALQEFRLISTMIFHTKKDVLFFLPGDIDILYGSDRQDSRKSSNMKKRLNLFSRWMKELDGNFDYNYGIIYAETKSKLGSTVLTSFYVFSSYSNQEGILFNESKTNKTIIKENNILRSTVIVENNEELKDLLTYLGYINNIRMDVPKWMEDVKMFDDEKQKQIIENSKTIIEQENLNIYSAEMKLESNDYIKSILYTQSDSLVETVFEIIEEIFNCDLSDFEDEKLEDFNFKANGKYYVGEIKGVTSNVKNENVSQLDVHYQRFIDENPDIDTENIYALLIMNHQRKKPIREREPVHINQIRLAKRNGSLIIETYELLKMLEELRNGNLSNEECIKMLSNKEAGILKVM